MRLLIPNEPANRHFVLRLLVSHFVVALTLMQSAFLNLFNDLLVTHCFGPFATPLLEASSCCFKRLLDYFAVNFEAPNVLFTASYFLTAGGAQVGNSCLGVLNVPGDFLFSSFQPADFTFGGFHVGFCHRYVRLLDLNEPLQPLQAGSLSIFHCNWAN